MKMQNTKGIIVNLLKGGCGIAPTPTVVQNDKSQFGATVSRIEINQVDDADGLRADGYDLNEIAVKLVHNYIRQITVYRFFHADPEANWEAFAQRYRDELTNNPALDALAAQLKENKTPVVTLLYGFRNPLRNHAVILREALMEKLNL